MSRKRVELKQQIVDGLKEFPMTTYGVSNYVNCHPNTAKNRLEELQEDGVVVQSDDKWRLNE